MSKNSLILGLIFLLASFSSYSFDDAEVKVTLKDNIEEVIQKLNLSEAKSDKREVYYFDSFSMDLYKRGIVLRARIKDNKKADTAAKVRPINPQEVDSFWFDLDGFACEIDLVGKSEKPSCRVKEKFAASELRPRLNSPYLDIETLFNMDQKKFIRHFDSSPNNIPWRNIKVLGPINVQTWDLDLKGKKEMTIEYWMLPTGKIIIEASLETPYSQAKGDYQRMISLLKSRGLNIHSSPETKTKTSIEEMIKFLNP